MVWQGTRPGDGLCLCASLPGCCPNGQAACLARFSLVWLSESAKGLPASERGRCGRGAGYVPRLAHKGGCPLHEEVLVSNPLLRGMCLYGYISGKMCARSLAYDSSAIVPPNYTYSDPWDATAMSIGISVALLMAVVLLWLALCEERGVCPARSLVKGSQVVFFHGADRKLGVSVRIRTISFASTRVPTIRIRTLRPLTRFWVSASLYVRRLATQTRGDSRPAGTCSRSGGDGKRQRC